MKKPEDKTGELENVLRVMVGHDELLVRSSDVREIVRTAELTPMPMGPSHLLGLANIHGQIVCIIDLSGISELSEGQPKGTVRSRFLLLKHPSKHVGIRVDDVRGMRRVPRERLASASAEGVLASFDIDGEPGYLLDCACLLA